MTELEKLNDTIKEYQFKVEKTVLGYKIIDETKNKYFNLKITPSNKIFFISTSIPIYSGAFYIYKLQFERFSKVFSIIENFLKK